MQTFKWLYQPAQPFNWRFVRNVVLKTALLFVIVNLLFVLATPVPTLGRITIYNWLVDGRDRLPYGENPAASYNLSLYQLDAMFASHDIAAAGDDFRVLLIGDSSIWGILLEPHETLAGQLNAADLTAPGGQPIRVYNLGYPTMSLTKDLMLLDYAMRYDPDLVVWSFTLESFGQRAQLRSSIVQNNADRVRSLITRYDLDQRPDDARLADRDTWDKTIMGQRRTLADMLRLQFYGVAWDITGIDQEYPDDYTPRAIDLAADTPWHGFDAGDLTPDDLAFDALRAGIARAGDVPVLLINEPMFISQGANSDVRYNAFFPRWAYDLYRDHLRRTADAEGWTLLDLWDLLPNADCYTDSAVHLTPDCVVREADAVAPALLARIGDE